MSAWAIVALVVLVIIVAAGICIKRYTRSIVKDMDGILDDIQIMHEHEIGKIIGMPEDGEKDDAVVAVENEAADNTES